MGYFSGNVQINPHTGPTFILIWKVNMVVSSPLVPPGVMLLLLLLLLLLSRFSRVRLCATPQTVAHQAPPSLGFSRQEHWSGLPFPSPMHESESESEVVESCPTLSNPMDCGPPGSSVHGILQARVLEWDAIPFSRGSSQPRDWTQSPALQAVSLPTGPLGKTLEYYPANNNTFITQTSFLQQNFMF